ncbi:MAG: hypothetical protein EBX52_08930 [Proteobacteria bacterium]|nr:hypothetical protein [Pseudomonadota bacterium]
MTETVAASAAVAEKAEEEEPVGIGDLIFGNRIRKKAVIEAIVRAEAGTSGEIRVHLSREKVEKDLVAHAREHFEKLGMHRTLRRNAVLLYVNPKLRKFALYGDQGIHAQVGPAFWSGLATQVSKNIRERNLTEGIIHAVEAIGSALKEHFPAKGPNPNELSNEVTED